MTSFRRRFWPTCSIHVPLSCPRLTSFHPTQRRANVPYYTSINHQLHLTLFHNRLTRIAAISRRRHKSLHLATSNKLHSDTRSNEATPKTTPYLIKAQRSNYFTKASKAVFCSYGTDKDGSNWGRSLGYPLTRWSPTLSIRNIFRVVFPVCS